MQIGGTVLDTKIIGDKVRIDIITDQYKECHSAFTELTAAAKCIQPDDSAFWNDTTIFWSPKSRCWRDYQLKRIDDVITKENSKKGVVSKSKK